MKPPGYQPIETVRERALQVISDERDRQETLRAQGRFTHTCASPGLTNAQRLAILVEEVGEVAGEVLAVDGVAFDRGTGERLRKEVLHVAAVAAAWLEYLESEV